MEVILEFIGEVIIEGLVELATAPKVPKIVRGICLTVITAAMLGFAGFFVYGAVAETSNTASRVLFLLIALFVLAGGIGFWVKVLRKKKK